MKILQSTLKRPVIGLSFGNGGRSLVAGGSGGYTVWNLADSSRTFIESHDAKYLYGCISDPLGRYILVSDALGGFRVITLNRECTIFTPGDKYCRHVTSFDLTPDGGTLLMNRGGAGLNRVECWAIRGSNFTPAWSLMDGKACDTAEPYYLNQSNWFTNGLAISSDGKLLVTAESRTSTSGNKPLVVVRSASTGRLKVELGQSETSFSSRVAISPDSRAAFVWDDRTLERWDLKKGLTAKSAAPGTAYFRGIAVHPSGRTVATVSSDAVRCWDAATLSPASTFKWKIGKLHSVAFRPDGTLGAVGGDKGQVLLWDSEAS